MNALQRLRRTFWWIRVPFTYGHALKESQGECLDGNDSEYDESVIVEFVKFDGLISAIQIFLLIIAITWTMTFTVHVSPQFNGSVALVTLTSFMIAGLAIMGAFNLHRKKVLAPAAVTGTQDMSRDKLALIGIVIFYMVVCLMDAFHITASVACGDTWKMCKDGRIYASYVTKVIFHVVRIIYLGAETLLCITFHRSTFSNRPSTRYGLMFLQAVNFSLWFDSLIHESVHLFDSGHEKKETFHQRCLADISNVSTAVFSCVYNNNTIYQLLEDYINPTFLPFTIEFTLLAGDSVFHWYYHCSALVNSQRSVEDRVEQTTSSHATSVADNSGPSGQLQSQEDLPNEVERELSSSSGDLLPLVESITSSPSRMHKFLSFVIFSLIIGVNVALCFLVIRQKYARDEDIIRYMKIYLNYLCVFWICMTITIAIGYHSSGKFKVSRERFAVLDYLLVFTSLGAYAVNVLTLISIGELETHASNVTVSSAISHATPFSPAFHTSLELLNASEVYFQVGFCLFAGRILIDFHDTRSYRTTVFKGTVLFLAVANGSLWLVGNIAGLGGVPVEFVLLRTYFEEVGWKYIRNISVFFPVSLFHRFICCLQFSKAYLRLS